jgi:hypothetical protein
MGKRGTQTGKTFSLEHRKNISMALYGNKNAKGNQNTRGRQLSQDEIQRRSKTYALNRLKPFASTLSGLLGFGA